MDSIEGGILMIENIIVLLLMFAVYAVLGWVTEVVFFALKT